MKSVTFVAFTVFSSIIGSCGVILNLIVCLLYIRNTYLLDAANIFVFNISLGDLLYSIVALPMLVMSNARGKWLFGEAGCTAYGFLTTFFALSSMMHLAGAAYERYVTLVKLFDNGQTEFGKKKAARLSIIMWCYSLIWSLMPVFGWSSYVLEGIGTSCSIKWKSKQAGDVSYAVCLCVGCFLLPVTVITYCYYKSYNSVRQMTDAAIQNWGENACITQETIKAERRMFYVITVIIAGFIVAWTPYAIVSLVALFGPDLVSDIGASIPAYIAKSSACYNPIIYAFTYKKLRNKLKTILWCRRATVNPESGTERPTFRNIDRTPSQNGQTEPPNL